VAELLALLPQADLYVQDEVDVRHHPTLTRVWSRKGHAGQRLVRAPGTSLKAVGFAAVNWRDGWCSWGFAPGRTAQPFVKKLDHLVERSQGRGWAAIVLLDNARIHTPQGAKVVREALGRHGEKLRLVPTPDYDPQANPAELLFRPFRRAVTHNHHRDDVVDLFRDAFRYFEDLDRHPGWALRHLGSPFTPGEGIVRSVA
jgi:transposase